MDNLFWYKLYFYSYFTNNGSLSLFTQAMDFSLSFASASASWLGCSCWKSKSVFPVKSLKVPDNESYCKRLMKAWSENIKWQVCKTLNSTTCVKISASQKCLQSVHLWRKKPKQLLFTPLNNIAAGLNTWNDTVLDIANHNYHAIPVADPDFELRGDRFWFICPVGFSSFCHFVVFYPK